jgi:hypothetical protein
MGTIISRDYFKLGEVFIPHAIDDPNDSNTGVKDNLDLFIDQYERDVLVKMLGYSLFKDFSSNLDISKPNGLIPAADVKWDQLLNGVEYTIDDTLVNFRGIRHLDGANPISLIAYYTYFFYLKDDAIKYTGTGNQVVEAANSETVSITPKQVKAWRRFYELTVGSYASYNIISNSYGVVGIDYYGSGENTERSVYEFIRDQNELVEDKYPNWTPSSFENINSFGI